MAYDPKYSIFFNTCKIYIMTSFNKSQVIVSELHSHKLFQSFESINLHEAMNSQFSGKVTLKSCNSMVKHLRNLISGILKICISLKTLLSIPVL